MYCLIFFKNGNRLSWSLNGYLKIINFRFDLGNFLSMIYYVLRSRGQHDRTCVLVNCLPGCICGPPGASRWIIVVGLG